MMKSLKMTVVAAAALGGMALASGNASAMPMAGLDKAAATAGVVEKTALVCGPFRCFYRPFGFYRRYGFYRPYGFYGRRFGYGWRGYGWRRFGWRGFGWRRRW